METIFHIIFLVLFIGVCICAGWSFGSCIRTEKKYDILIEYYTKILKNLEETHKDLIEIHKNDKEIIKNNKEILRHTDGVINFLKGDIKFIRQNMTRRKTPIIDE